MQPVDDVPGWAWGGASATDQIAINRVNNPEYATLCQQAQVLLVHRELGAAIKISHAAVSLDPCRFEAYHIIAACHMNLRSWIDALEALEWAWLVDQSNEETLKGVQRVRNELAACNPQSARIRPWSELSVNGFYSRAVKQFADVKNYPSAFLAGQLAEKEKNPHFVETELANLRMEVCDWPALLELRDSLESGRWREGSGLSPWLALHLIDAPKLHLEVVQRFLNDRRGHQAVRTRKLRHARISGRRPKIGYLSADFHDHATTRLMVAMLEQHDRRKWEIFGLSYGPDDKSPMRKRVEKAFEHFIDLHGIGEASGVEQIRDLDLDVLVDVKGLTANFVPEYTISRPAPVVVNYLAYPGSMGSASYDYVLGDTVVTPFDKQLQFTECIVQLPHSYQCNDPLRKVSPATPSRVDAGLPDDGIVFAAFNNTRKITPEVFAVWMKILLRVPGSVIWLIASEPLTQRNLREAAGLQGVESYRLVFAPSLRADLHMARHRLADMFLDTFPYNAHTTASDALWMGVPVVTMQGESFASRVASSLLHTSGLSELIVQNWIEYEELVVCSACSPLKLAKLKEHLLSQREFNPLFDPIRLAKNMEQAFAFMIDRSRSGKPPHPFSVRDSDEGGGCRLLGSKAYKTQFNIW